MTEFLSSEMPEDVRKQAMEASIKYIMLKTAYHAIFSHTPITTMHDNTLHVSWRSDNCVDYCIIDRKFTAEDLVHEPVVDSFQFFTWIMTAMEDSDNGVNFDYPAVIDGPRIRVEIG